MTSPETTAPMITDETREVADEVVAVFLYFRHTLKHHQISDEVAASLTVAALARHGKGQVLVPNEDPAEAERVRRETDDINANLPDNSGY